MALGIFLFIAGLATGVALMWMAALIGEEIVNGQTVPDSED